MKQKEADLVLHTHWDREWRYPIWENRMYLCDLMDELLHTLDTDPEYAAFLLDGQSVIIEDYLQVRPENREKVERYISQGRIEVGPWYTLPDLYPLCGESLVRNLQKGMRLSEKLGKCTKVAYESFGWGQTAQFPQIYRQFGLNFAIVAKNVDFSRTKHSEFIWEAPDGTKMLATKLGTSGRANFFMNAYLRIMTGLDYNTNEYEYSPNKQGFIYHRADGNGFWNDCHKINYDETIHEEYLRSSVDTAINGMALSTNHDFIPLFDGSDSTTSQPLISRLIRRMNEVYPDIDFKHVSLDEFVRKAAQVYKENELVVVVGELRDGPTYGCSANALATRPRIKLMNKKAEAALFKFAEPLCFMANLKEKSFHDLAEDYLLKAHPHDSINGVTQEKTAEDNLFRLAQTVEISEVLSDRACETIVRKLDMSSFSDTDTPLVLFNTLPFDRSENLHLYIDLPQSESVWDFEVTDANGNALTKQIISRKQVSLPVSALHARPYPYFVDRLETCVAVDNIPAMGYKVLRIVKTQGFNRRAMFWQDIRRTDGHEIARDCRTLENCFIKLTVNKNGSINLFDKKTGREFSRLNYFEETGDYGDYWIYYPPYHNKTFTTLGQQADIWLEENGDVQATVGVRINMMLPEDTDAEKRSNHFVPFPIEVYYTLGKDSRQVNVRVKLNNQIKNHKLRVMFDTGENSDSVESAGHFYTDVRPVAKEGSSGVGGNLKPGEFYQDMQTLPMNYFVRRSGLTILNNCFCEYEGINNAEGTLAVSLMRCVRNYICTEFRSAGDFPHENGGQSFGELEFSYAVSVGNDAYRDAERFIAPIKAVQISKGSGTELPLEKSYLKIENVVVSAIQPANDSDGYIVRMFNPTDETRCVELSGTEVTLNEDVIGRFNGEVGPYKIVSVKLD